jgi:hypothetical protein
VVSGEATNTNCIDFGLMVVGQKVTVTLKQLIKPETSLKSNEIL